MARAAVSLSLGKWFRNRFGGAQGRAGEPWMIAGAERRRRAELRATRLHAFGPRRRHDRVRDRHPAEVNANAPTIWIAQDDFVVVKYRSPIN